MLDSSKNWLQFYQVDVFTSEPFGGNPLAVFPSGEELSEREFQQIAREMNLSETVFVLPPTDSKGCSQSPYFYPFSRNSVCGASYIGDLLCSRSPEVSYVAGARDESVL